MYSRAKKVFKIQFTGKVNETKIYIINYLGNPGKECANVFHQIMDDIEDSTSRIVKFQVAVVMDDIPISKIEDWNNFPVDTVFQFLAEDMAYQLL